MVSDRLVHFCSGCSVSRSRKITNFNSLTSKEGGIQIALQIRSFACLLAIRFQIARECVEMEERVHWRMDVSALPSQAVPIFCRHNGILKVVVVRAWCSCPACERQARKLKEGWCHAIQRHDRTRTGLWAGNTWFFLEGRKGKLWQPSSNWVEDGCQLCVISLTGRWPMLQIVDASSAVFVVV